MTVVKSKSKELFEKLIKIASKSDDEGNFAELKHYKRFIKCIEKLYHQSLEDNFYWDFPISPPFTTIRIGKGRKVEY